MRKIDEDKKYVYQFNRVRVVYGYTDCIANRSGEELREEYRRLLRDRDDINLYSNDILLAVLKSIFDTRLRVKSKERFEKILLDKYAFTCVDTLYYVIRNDKLQGIITKKMLEE